MTNLLTPGTTLQGRYKIISLLGQGGMSAVYLAEDTRFGNLVAIKENFDTTPEAQHQFQFEALVLARLKHPCLPRVFDHFTEPSGKQYLVMDFIEGNDLEELLDKQGPLPENQVLTWMRRICDALQYMHEQQPPVIHRDIKPANIKLTPDGQVVLVDFGIAKTYMPGKQTVVGARAVTPGYAPPEQYGAGTDARSDIYALGATMYHLLTGQVPPESITIIRTNSLIPPRQLNPAISSGVEQITLKAMALNPSQRYQSAQEMKQVLASGTPPVVASTSRRLPHMSVPISKFVLSLPRVVIGTGLLVLLLIMAAVGSYLWNSLLPAMIPRVSLTATNTVVEISTTAPLSPRLITVGNVAQLTHLAELNWEAFDLAWSPDGRTLAMATANGVVLYDPAAVTQTKFITTTVPLALAYSPEGRWLVTGSTDNVVQLWDVSSGNVSFQLQGHAAPITDVAFDTSGQLLASSSRDNSVRVWDVARQVEQYHLKGHSNWVLVIAFSPDGRWLASGSRDHSVRLWNMENGTAMHAFHRDTESVTSVAITPDSRLLASGSEDGTLRLWDIEKLTEVHVLASHLAGVTSVAFNHDGRLLASGGKDGTIRLWDMETWVELRTLKGHTGEVLSVAFSPDGHWLASASNDGTVRLWGVR